MTTSIAPSLHFSRVTHTVLTRHIIFSTTLRILAKQNQTFRLSQTYPRSPAMAFKMQQKRAAAVLAVFLLGCSCFASVQARVNQMGELKILAIGDSITQGSVPSKGANHPYTIQLQNILQSKYPGMNIVIDNQGVGGSGIFAVGFHRPTTIVPVAMDSINSAKSSGRMYDYTVVMVGINDLLRVGKSADEVMSGLNQIYDAALSSGSNVIAIPPFAAPGFVSQSDYKEGERKKLAGLIHAAASSQNSRRFSPKMSVLDLQSGTMDFYAMDENSRKSYLDDGLHMTEYGYDQLAGHIAGLVQPSSQVSKRH